jgi:sugar lactone lactonase YvrE
VRVSPRGDLIAFSADDGEGLTVVDMAGRRTVLAPHRYGISGLAWSTRADEVWFTETETALFSNIRSLCAVGTNGRRRVVWRAVGPSLHDIAVDGRALITIYTERKGILCLAPGETQERDLSWLDYGHVADISADGATLLFTERSGGRNVESVFLRPTDGSPAIRLGDGAAIALSPDGRWALAVGFEKPTSMELQGHARFVLLPTGAGESRPVNDEGAECFAVGWFPDSRRLLVGCAEAGGQPRAYSHDVETGERRALTQDGLSPHFRPSPDGSRIVAADGDGSLWVVAVEGGDRRPLPRLEVGEELVQWSADGRSMYVRRGSGERVQVDRLDLESGRRERWRVLAPDPSRGARYLPLVMTPDGASYAYTYGRFSSDLFLVKGLA